MLRNIWIATALILVWICAYETSATSLQRLHWVFIHYHKTGHDLCTYFGHSMFNITHTASGMCRDVSLGEIHTIQEFNTTALASWDSTIIRPRHFKFDVFNDGGHHYRIVHFIRDPFDMVISGYLYHRQTPFPQPEGFLGREEYDACRYDAAAMSDAYIPALQSYAKKTANIAEMIANVSALCKQLRSRYAAPTFHKAINLARQGSDVLDGMRLEACRAVLNAFNGDILRMAHNALQESNLRQGKVLRLFTTEFPVTDALKYRQTTERMYDFLMQEGQVESGGDTPFFSCVSKQAAVLAALNASFASLPRQYAVRSALFDNPAGLGISKRTDKRAHITSDQITVEARARYASRLEADPVLRPLLLIVRGIVSKV